MYIDSRKEGTLNYFVSDFLQDEFGRFHFIKISDFKTDNMPVQTGDWIVSSTLKEQDMKRKAAKAGSNTCNAQIICELSPAVKLKRQKTIFWCERSA